ncbi:hypothetical protein CVT25_010785 [Psilocybe cyanescens]|uniref:Uncharacterized protein n=1 Tax=Psilocybe cyanescens TaxID=93625 RepID=A0A409XSX8_PSICY|nr:hypothetical protein CVT25_010785 [Psilocybe cyanescens]
MDTPVASNAVAATTVTEPTVAETTVVETTVADTPSIEASLSKISLNINKFADAAAAGNSRALEFSSRNLGKEIDLLLMFEPPKVGKLYVDLFPVVWKVLSFSATGISSADVEYTADTGFFVPQAKSGNRVAASNAQRCQTGEKVTLKNNLNGNGQYFTPAVAGTPGVMQALNGTERPADMGIGFFNDAGTKMEPALVWNNVAKNSTLSVQLTPKLKIYAVSDYKVTELIKGDIQSPLLFEKNLISLSSFTELTVSIHPVTGEVKITQE